MAILKSKDIAKMDEKEINEKISELRMQLIKSHAESKKSGKSNTKEIKRTIAKLLTIKNMKNKTGGKK